MLKQYLHKWTATISRKVPLRVVLVVPFLVQTFAAVGLTGWLSLRNGQQAVNDVSTQLCQEITDKIKQHLQQYLTTPYIINKFNIEALTHDHFGLEDDQEIVEHIWNYLEFFPSVKSIFFANDPNIYIQIEKIEPEQFLLAELRPDQSLYSYHLDPKLNKTELDKLKDNFNLKQEFWYQSIVQAEGKPIWIELTKNFNLEYESILMQGVAIYNQKKQLIGVTGVKISLTQISQFLQGLKIGQSGQTFILDRSGQIIASSQPSEPNLSSHSTLTRQKYEQSLIQAKLKPVLKQLINFNSFEASQQLIWFYEGERQFVQVMPFNDEFGLEWFIVVVIPESDFMQKIHENTRFTIFLCIVALLFAILLGLITSRWIIRSIKSMSQGALAISQGDWNQTVIGRTSELFHLAEVFNSMAKQLQQSFATLEQQKSNLAEAQKVAHVGSWEWDLISQQFKASVELLRILGENNSVVNYHDYQKLIHPDDQEVYQTCIEEAIFRGKKFELDYRIVEADGLIRYVYGKGKPTLNDQGKTIRIVGTLMDITERKLAEKALQTSEAQLQQKTRQLEQTLQELQKTQAHLVQSEKMSSLGQLVAGIAHEINNPVSFIYGNITFAREYAKNLISLLEVYQTEYKLTPEVQEKIEEIDLNYLLNDFPKLLDSMQMGAERIQAIVKSLRTFSRLDESPIKDIDIHEGIDSTLLILQSRLKAYAEQIPINIIKNYGKLPKVECYAGLLNQVFMNILVNAIDAIEDYSRKQTEPKNFWIQITTELNKNPTAFSGSSFDLKQLEQQKPDQVVIRIQDNGPGMPKSVQERLFDPFFTTKPTGKGTGLGLSISYQIITDKHKGQLECISQVGEGTEFIITIPVAQTYNLPQSTT